MSRTRTKGCRWQMTRRGIDENAARQRPTRRADHFMRFARLGDVGQEISVLAIDDPFYDYVR